VFSRCVRFGLQVDAVLHVNPKLKLNPKYDDVALYALTRLDLSNNILEWLPPAALQLRSLKWVSSKWRLHPKRAKPNWCYLFDCVRYLNLAQNKIEKLPEGVKEGPKSPTKYRRRSSSTASGTEAVYNMPVLEELYLQVSRWYWLRLPSRFCRSNKTMWREFLFFYFIFRILGSVVAFFVEVTKLFGWNFHCLFIFRTIGWSRYPKRSSGCLP